MRIAVFGAGSVGGYFGARLAQAGHSVVFIARGRTLEALRKDGLRVESIAGDFRVHDAEATDAPASVGPVDAVLLGVKTWQVPEAAVAMRPLVGENTLVVPLLNGVECRDQLAAVLGPKPVLGGICRIFAYPIAPGVFKHAGVDPAVVFGEWDGGPSERVSHLAAAFDDCVAAKAVATPKVQTAVWEKFLFIDPLGTTGSLSRAPVGVLRGIPETRALLEGLIREVLALALARGVAMRDDIVLKTLGHVDAITPEGTASMQRDMLDGKPSELDAQTGAVVRLAREAGVAVPLHAAAYGALLPAEQRARGSLRY